MNAGAGETFFVTRASIFERIRAKEPAQRELAWCDFRAKYAPIVAGFCKAMGASGQDIDDIVQDVMLGFLGVSEEFRYSPVRGRFRGFLKVCTVRAVQRRPGKNLRHRGKPLEEIPADDLAIDHVWNDVWEQELLARALDQLRRELGGTTAFQAFEQYVLLDRPAEAVANEFGTSVNNVHQAKTRMTRQLRETLQKLREMED
ncbi:MAG TPA: sigma-70 family RNA polymerase sigma factor [Lacipirellulaceae bacterium]|nr:sigma-70 family RNA polymerase sigma factor [Lacipirellulaceae bacterium]